MKDNFGNELNVGDVVYFATTYSWGQVYSLEKGVVSGFTSQKIKVKMSNKIWRNKVTTITPQKVGKVFVK